MGGQIRKEDLIDEKSITEVFESISKKADELVSKFNGISNECNKLMSLIKK